MTEKEMRAKELELELDRRISDAVAGLNVPPDMLRKIAVSLGYNLKITCTEYYLNGARHIYEETMREFLPVKKKVQKNELLEFLSFIDLSKTNSFQGDKFIKEHTPLVDWGKIEKIGNGWCGKKEHEEAK